MTHAQTHSRASAGGRRRPVAALMMVLLSGALLAGCSDSPEQMLDSAREYLAKDDLQAASIQLKNALQQNGSLAEARFLLGEVYLRQDDVPAAVKELQRAEELGVPSERVAPLLAEALVRSAEFDRVIQKYAELRLADPAAQGRVSAALGTAYLAKAQLDRARQTFESATAAAPDDLDARLGLARVKFFANDLDGAERELAPVLEKHPNKAEAYVLQAQIMLARDQADRAVEALTAAVRSQPDSASYRYDLITLLLRQNKAEEAKAQIEEMRRIAPDAPATHYLTALIAHREGRDAEARDAVRLALRGAPDFLPAHMLAGSVMYRLGDHAQAQLSLNKVLERVPRHLQARQLLAMSLLQSAQAARALETLKPLIDAEPQDARSLMVIGQALLANGEFEAAADYFSRASSQAPDSAGARMRLGMARMVGGDSAQGLADLEAATNLDGTGIQADAALVLAHLRGRNYDKALAAADKMLERHPGNAEAHNLKGGVHMARRDIAAARESFETALKLRPDMLSALVNLVRIDVGDGKPEAALGRFESFLATNPGHVDATLAFAEFKSASGAPAGEVRALLDRAVGEAPGALGPKLALVRHLLRQGEARPALSLAQEAAAAHSADPGALGALGSAQLAAGEHQQAISTFGRLAALLPRSPVPLIDLAAAQAAAKDLSGAEQSLRRAIGLQPANGLAHERLQALLVEQQRLDDALALAREMQGKPALAQAGFAAEGDIQARRENWAAAVTAFQRAAAVTPNAEVQVRLYGALLRAGRADEADRMAADWIRAQPRDTMMRTLVAQRAIAQNRLQDARRLYEEALAVNPDDAMVLNNLAWVEGELKEPGALARAERALALAPDHPAILDTLGTLQIAGGDSEKGLKNLRRAVELAPDLGPLRLNLARAYLKLERKADAREQLDILLGKVPAGTPVHREATELRAAL